MSTRCMCYATVRTSVSAPSWLTSWPTPQDFIRQGKEHVPLGGGGPEGADTLCPENWVASHQVKARGPGLEKTGVAVNKPAEFTVDAKHEREGSSQGPSQGRGAPRAEAGWAGAQTVMTRRPFAPAHFAGQ